MNSVRLKKFVLFSLCISLFLAVSAQQLAFPGAEGAGAYATGGRGTAIVPTTVYEVTNLNDDNLLGSLRYAITNNSPAAPYRTIVFRVSGTIHLNSALAINRANTTVAGQTAPGDGICIADYPVSISNDNVIIRFIRFRMGDKNQNKGMINGGGSDDAFGSLGRKNLIIDHCTMSWSSDEACTIYRGDSTTLQWNIISEPLNYSYHFETGDVDFELHGYGGIWGGRKASLHHNLFAHLKGRVPRFDGSRNLPSSASPVIGSENADFRNNVLYDWSDYNVNGGEGGNYNIINNYYKYGPSTLTNNTSGVNRRYMTLNPYKQASPVLPYGKYYMTGNYVDSLPGIPSVTTDNNWRGAAMNGSTYADTTLAKADVAFNIASPITTQDALQAYELVLQNAGAILPQRDTLDQRIVNDVRNRTGRLIDVQGGYPHGTPYNQTVSAWPTLNSLPAPADTDHDGMPDDWETPNGLNPNDAADRNIIGNDGYTMLERYLYRIAVNAPLPLTLVSFRGKYDQSQVKLSWITANELNVKSFVVEKSSDGQNFITAGFVIAKNIAGGHEYEYIDADAVAGVLYYRLNIIDVNGKYEYSRIITINLNSGKHLELFPNPASSTLTIKYPAASSGILRISSITGKLLKRINIKPGSFQTQINISTLPRGSYFITMYDGKVQNTTSFIKR